MAIESVRVPPDSTGKRINAGHGMQLAYTAGTRLLVVGETVVGGASGAEGYVARIEGTAASGNVFMRHIAGTTETFNDGEALQVEASTICTAGAQTDFYTQKVINVGGTNPENSQSVDNQGASFVRFADGSPQFDAFGKQQVSQQHKIAEYIHSYDELPNDYTTVAVGSATVAYEANSAGVVLSCTTLSGDSIQRTSDEYHVYQAGISHLIEMTAACGDTGKANVTRRWGYYDDENGVYFELAGTTLSVGLRSNATGTPVDTLVAQADFNSDVVDGTFSTDNLSGANLDVSKDNIYWIDFQWLGAGTIRYGVVIDGVRFPVHQWQNANLNTGSFMTTGTLPVRYEQINTGAAGSTSEFRLFAAAVKTEGAYNPFRRAFGQASDGFVVVSATVKSPLIAIRPMHQYKGKDNRATIYPNNFSIYNESSTDAVVFEIVRNGTPVGGTWASTPVGESVAEVNVSSSAVTGGSVRHNTIIGPGESRTIDFKTFSDNGRGLRRGANASASYSRHVYTARGLTAAASANVAFTLNWDEVRN